MKKNTSKSSSKSHNRPLPLNLVYGVHPVLELLKQKKRKIFDLFILQNEPKVWEQLQPLLPKYPFNIHRLQRQDLTQKLGTPDHQGIAVTAEPFVFKKTLFESSKAPFIVLLDGIQDVRNLGAIIRSAYCIGVDGIVLVKTRSASIQGALEGPTLKASAGLAERMAIYETTSLAQTITELKKQGYHFYVAALSATANAYSLKYEKPACLIIGSEQSGVSSPSLKAGTIVTLPQKADDVSFNASVAAGILMSLIFNSK